MSERGGTHWATAAVTHWATDVAMRRCWDRITEHGPAVRYDWSPGGLVNGDDAGH